MGLNTFIPEKTTEYSMLHRYPTFSFVYWYNSQVLLLMICMCCMYSMYGHHLLIAESMDQQRKVAKPSRGQLNREMKCPCKCIRGKYICTAVIICLHLFFTWVQAHSFVHGLLLYMHICLTTAVPVRIIYYECSSTYMYMLCTMMSVALLKICKSICDPARGGVLDGGGRGEFPLPARLLCLSARQNL